ncbi:MAG: zinc ribbon domain-containing protein, partial [Acidilobaceae archaeon]
YRVKDWKIIVTVKPWELYLEFDISRAWFRGRVEGLDMGELILKEDRLIITYRKPVEQGKPILRIGWDVNMISLDGFSPKIGWIRISLKKLYHIHRAHEIRRAKAQSTASKKPSIKPIVSRHGFRERRRANDFVHKLTTGLARMFPGALHGFEDLEKHGMYGGSEEHNRSVAKQNWKQIVKYVSYKSRVRLVDPRGTSKTCPMCGGEMVKLQEGRAVMCPSCGLTLDRQLCGAINIYLKMCGFPRGPSTFYNVVIKKMSPLWKARRRPPGGVTAKGGEGLGQAPSEPMRGKEPVEPQG